MPFARGNVLALRDTPGLNRNGYQRVSARNSFRGAYVHRLVMERLLGGPIPPGFEVHHMDGNRRHNCPENLLLIDVRLHHPGQNRQITPR